MDRLKVKSWVMTTLAGVGAVFFIFFVFSISSAMSRRADTYALMNAESSDGVNSMGVLANTTWTNSNGFLANGPLYYRLARTALLLDPMYWSSSEAYSDIRDRASHSALMLIAFLSVVALAFALAVITSPRGAWGWVSLLYLVSFLGTSELWARFSFINHPDSLLALLVGLAIWRSHAAFVGGAKAKMHFAEAGAIWGLAMLAKTSALFFFFGGALQVVLMGVLNRENFRKVLKDLYVLVGAAAVTYLVVGFPQSVDVGLLKHFLQTRVEISDRVNGAWDFSYWWRTLIEVGLYPSIAVIAVCGTFQRPKFDSRLRRVFLTAWLVPLVGFVVLLPMAFPDYRKHYIMPVVSVTLFCLVPWAHWPIAWVEARLAKRLRKWVPVLSVLILVVVLGVSIRGFSANTTSQFLVNEQFRKDAEAVQAKLVEFQKAQQAVVLDPYTPYDARNYPTFVEPENFTAGAIGRLVDADAYISSKFYYKRFLPDVIQQWQLIVMSERKFKESHDFYTPLFRGVDHFMDGRGRRWNLDLRTASGWDIWRLASKPLQGKTLFKKRDLSPEILKFNSGAISLWANLEDPQKGNGVLISARSDEGIPRSIYFDHNANGTFGLIFSGASIDTSALKVVTRKWHHYVLSWQEGRQELFVDGVLVAKGTATLQSNPCRRFFVGHLGEGGDDHPWEGGISDVRVLQKPLTQDEALGLYRKGP